MTVSTTTNKVSYSGTGSQTVFAYSFKIFADGDLDVYIRDTNGTETLQTITTHYTVSGAGSDSGGNVTFVTAPGSTDTVVIQRKLDLTQGTDYVANDPFPAASHEDALDRLTFITQQIQEEVDRSIKASVTNTISSSEFAISASDRANKIFAFDSSGDLAVTQEIGTFRGDWAASTAYNQRDLVKDTSTNNIFIVNTAHTSSGAQPLTTNANSAKYDLIVDAASATTSATNAASSATTASGHADDAQDWATKVNGIVEATGYSSKAWAIGGTGVTDTASSGAAKEWATETSGTVDTAEYSSKEYAQGTQSGTGGSAKSWAQTAEDTVVSGGEYSAKHYSAKASASATAAAADAVSTAADVVSTNADVVLTNADVVSAQASATAASNSAAALAAALDGFDDKYLGIMADTDTASSASTTATWVLGGSTLTVASASGIEVGQNVSATGIPNQANVLSIDGTSVVISHVATAAGSGAAVTFQGYGVYGAFDSSIDGPSTDNDNGALSEGMLYFNSTDNEMRVYDGANWIAASAATQASMNIFEYTAGAGDTTFSGLDDNGATLSYTADNLIVMMNGAVLDPDEFTATNGTSVVLDSAAAASDEIVIYAFKSFTVADTVSKASGGSFTGKVTFSGGAEMAGDLDLDGEELILDADGDTSITADTDDQIDFRTGGTDRMHLTSDGKLGVGTSAPEKNISVDKKIGLQSTQSSAGDVIGELSFVNMTNAGSGSGTSFVRDVAMIQGKMVGTGNNSGGSLHFSIKDDGGSRTEAMEIDGDGYVSPKLIPAFQLNMTGNLTTNGGTFQSSGTPQINNGSHWSTSNHRFTAPRAGKYVIYWTGYTNFTNNYGYLNIYKNGSNFYDWHFNHNTTGNIHEISGATVLMDLAASDYVDFRRGGGGSGTWAALRVGGYLLFY